MKLGLLIDSQRIALTFKLFKMFRACLDVIVCQKPKY